MSLGLTLYTLFHVAISLVGIGAGLVVVSGLVRGQRLDGWTAIFLSTTVATSVTGFGFPFVKLLPSHIVGAISLVVLVPTLYARYSRHLEGSWRPVYVVGALVALYLNVFVLVVQLFLKVPGLTVLAPTQSEPPFVVTQAVVLAIFAGLTLASLAGFRAAAIRGMERSLRPHDGPSLYV